MCTGLQARSRIVAWYFMCKFLIYNSFISLFVFRSYAHKVAHHQIKSLIP